MSSPAKTPTRYVLSMVQPYYKGPSYARNQPKCKAPTYSAKQVVALQSRWNLPATAFAEYDPENPPAAIWYYPVDASGFYIFTSYPPGPGDHFAKFSNPLASKVLAKYPDAKTITHITVPITAFNHPIIAPILSLLPTGIPAHMQTTPCLLPPALSSAHQIYSLVPEPSLWCQIIRHLGKDGVDLVSTCKDMWQLYREHESELITSAQLSHSRYNPSWHAPHLVTECQLLFGVPHCRTAPACTQYNLAQSGDIYSRATYAVRGQAVFNLDGPHTPYWGSLVRLT